MLRVLFPWKSRQLDVVRRTLHGGYYLIRMERGTRRGSLWTDPGVDRNVKVEKEQKFVSLKRGQEVLQEWALMEGWYLL